MIQTLILTIIYTALFIWMNSYKTKQQNSVKKDTKSYSISLPNVLKNVYTIMFVFGIVLTIIFGYCYINKIANATIGHIIFSLSFATIGLIVMYICVRWRIDVKNDEFTIYYVFKKRKTYLFKEVNKASIGNKGQLIIYVNHKKVRTIDSMCINREIIEKRFKSDGKIVEEYL